MTNVVLLRKIVIISFTDCAIQAHLRNVVQIVVSVARCLKLMRHQIKHERVDTLRGPGTLFVEDRDAHRIHLGTGRGHWDCSEKGLHRPCPTAKSAGVGASPPSWSEWIHGDAWRVHRLTHFVAQVIVNGQNFFFLSLF